jgi:hypothetical protein
MKGLALILCAIVLITCIWNICDALSDKNKHSMGGWFVALLMTISFIYMVLWKGL